MKYLLFGISSSLLIIFAFSACDVKTSVIDHDYTTNYVYKNELNVPVKMEYHWTETIYSITENKTKTETIDPEKSLKETITLQGERATVIMICDSIRFVFDDTKELWYRHTEEAQEEGSVFEIANYAHTDNSKYESTYSYTISQKIYDLASPIE